MVSCLVCGILNAKNLHYEPRGHESSGGARASIDALTPGISPPLHVMKANTRVYKSIHKYSLHINKLVDRAMVHFNAEK